MTSTSSALSPRTSKANLPESNRAAALTPDERDRILLERRAQGLTERVSDPGTLARIADLLSVPELKRVRAAGPPHKVTVDGLGNTFPRPPS